MLVGWMLSIWRKICVYVRKENVVYEEEKVKNVEKDIKSCVTFLLL